MVDINTYISGVLNYLANGTILGIPIIVVIFITAIFGFVIFLIISRKIEPKIPKFKSLDLKKQIKKDMDFLYNKLGISINRPIYHGIINIGFAQGFFPITWSKEVSIKDNVAKEKNKEVRDAVMQIRNEKKTERVTIDMKAYKMVSNNIFNKIIGKIGLGVKYIIIDNDMVSNSDYGLVINPMAQPALFEGLLFFSKSGRDFIEDIAFRINRENELQEIANQVPRVVFWDNELSKRVIMEREKASIDEKRFKGQKEGAED